MEIHGSSVSLLAQGKEDPPIQALAKLGILVESISEMLQEPSSVEDTRQQFLHCLWLSTAATKHSCIGQGVCCSAEANQLSNFLSKFKSRVLIEARAGAGRNRDIFFCAILSGDTAAAQFLADSGVVEAMCEVLKQACTP